MIGSWIFYDLLCKSPLGKRDGLLGLVIFGFITALAWGLSHVFGGRAAFIHVGAAIGTIMAGNVAMVIIPGQRRMVAAMKAGQAPNPADGKRAKQRSVHNNYFTLPVIFIMVSNHYATTYAHPYNWAVLMLIAAAGVSIRHFFNRKHKGVYAWQYPALGAVLLAIVAWWTMPRLAPLPAVEGEVNFNRVRSIVGNRCVACHSPRPDFPGHRGGAGRRAAAHAGRSARECAARVSAGGRHARHAAGQRDADDRPGTRRHCGVDQDRREAGVD